MKHKYNLVLIMLLITTNSAISAQNFEYTEATTSTPTYQTNNYQTNNYQADNSQYQNSQYDNSQRGNRPPRNNSERGQNQMNSYNEYSETQQQNNQTLKGKVVTVPAGNSFDAMVTTPINSANLALGQTVQIALGTDFYYNNNLIAPAGSTVSGQVIEVSKAKRGSMNGSLLVRFTQIVTPYGVQIPIAAVIKTSDDTGKLVGGTKLDVTKAYAKDIAIGAGAGAVAGVIISPLSGGDIGTGTALATGVGAGAGVVKSIWDKGSDVEIPAGSQIQLTLTQPITVNPTINSQY
ncbi:MAG: hypothetical protein R3Y28_00935 [Candidatus Gastranaerophilales bacterium]